jgi:ATP-binding cassette subfamily F protein 3
MPVLAATNLTLQYGDDLILSDVSLTIEDNQRLGIVGRNGAGKSSLIKILGGAIKPDSGSVSTSKGARIGYLTQNPDLNPDDTLRDAVAGAFKHLHELAQELERVFVKMSGASDGELDKLLKQQQRLEHEIEALGGLALDHKVDAIIYGLGFSDAQHEIRVRDLSGGQRARVALARLLLQDPSVLLLDEPTNHLDIQGREWLESFLRDEFKGAVVLISHDRYMLDRVVDRIVEIEDARLIDYPGNYAAFRSQREQRRLTQMRAYEKQQTKFKREEAYIRQYKAGQRAKQARGRESRLEREKQQSSIERPLELDALRLSLPKARRAGDIVIAARDLAKSYPNEDGSRKILFHDLSIKIERGQRLGIIGPNGAGKSTLVRCLLGEQSTDAGEITLGTNLDIGHFTQTHEGLAPEKTVYRQIQDHVKKLTDDQVTLSELEARTIAGAFLFSGEDQEKEVAILSGGEKARTLLAALLASAKNLLVLDEPTNHLDIPSAERIESAFAREKHDPKTGKTTKGAYDGTLLLISHDRALIDAVCDQLLILDGQGGATLFGGTYSEWRESQREQSSDPAPKPKRDESPTVSVPKPASTPNLPKAKPQTRSRFSWMPIASIEERMTDLEIELRTLDAQLADADLWKDIDHANAVTSKRDEVKDELGELEEEWLRKSE